MALNVSPLARELVLHAVSRNTIMREARADRRVVQVLVDQLATASQVPLQLPVPADARARRAAELLHRAPRTPLKALARTVGASPRTLERLFLRDTAMPLGRWRRRARLIAALRRLAEGLPVTLVAMDVGYQTPSAFVAAFRRELGTTPGRYFSG